MVYFEDVKEHNDMRIDCKGGLYLDKYNWECVRLKYESSIDALGAKQH